MEFTDLFLDEESLFKMNELKPVFSNHALQF